MNVIVEVVEPDKLLDALLQGTVDLGLDWGPIRRPGIIREPLVEERWVIVAAPHHPLAALPLVSREQLAATPFLGLTVGAHTIEFADEGMQAVGLRRHVVQRLPFQDAVKRLVEAGRGISMMAPIAAEREIAAGHLTTLNVEGFALKYTLLLLRRAGQPHAPAVETFAAFLRQHPRLRAPLNP